MPSLYLVFEDSVCDIVVGNLSFPHVSLPFFLFSLIRLSFGYWKFLWVF